MMSPAILSLLCGEEGAEIGLSHAVAIRAAQQAGASTADREIQRGGLGSLDFPGHEDIWMREVVVAARQARVIDQADHGRWLDRCAQGEALREPRVQAFLASYSERVAIYLSSSTEKAHRALAGFLETPLNALRPWRVVGGSFVVFRFGLESFVFTPEDSDSFLGATSAPIESEDVGAVGGEGRSTAPVHGTRVYSSALQEHAIRYLDGDQVFYQLL